MHAPPGQAWRHGTRRDGESVASYEVLSTDIVVASYEVLSPASVASYVPLSTDIGVAS